MSFSVFGPKRKNVNFWAKAQIHKSIKTLCNYIKAPKVLPLEGVAGFGRVDVLVELKVDIKNVSGVWNIITHH